MKYEKPTVIIFDKKIMDEIMALAGSGPCHCGNGSSQNGSKRSKA